MSKTQPVTSSGTNLPAIVSADPIGKSLAAKYGFLVPRVDPKEYLGKSSEPIDDEAILEQFQREGYADVQRAFEAAAGIFGVARFANKNELADQNAPFYVEEIVQRIDGGFSQDDDWALKIVLAETGECQTLTLESNPGRDRFLYLLAFAMSTHPGQRPLANIARVDRKDKPSFFVIGPTSLGANNLRHVNAAQTIDAEFTPA